MSSDSRTSPMPTFDPSGSRVVPLDVQVAGPGAREAPHAAMPTGNRSALNTEDDADLFDSLAADFLARFRSGERPSVEAYATQHPELAAEIRELFPTMLTIERMKLEKEHSSDGRASLGARQLTRLGDFRIIREVGRGGMGIVYEAEQESLERRVALKVLPPNALHDESHVRRFHREARTAAALHHTNIVPVFGVGEAEGLHYYVMQLIDGESLDSRLQSSQRPSLSPREAADIILRVAQAVQFAHDHKTLHRDIKPANILVDREGGVWITDFGLAQALERDETATDHVAGTLRYMAPERFRGIADERTDQYGLGITLYELIAGRRVFDGATSGELMQRIIEKDPAPLRSFVPDLPRDLQTIVEKAIAKDPAHRYRTVSDFAADLRNFLQGRPITARPISAPERLWRWCQRNPHLAASLASVAILLVVVASMLTVGYFRARQLNQNLEAALAKEQAALYQEQAARLRESTALENERRARELERQAREAAESITNLALEGLDRVFDEFAPASTYTVALPVSGEAGEAADPLLLPAQPSVSPQVAAALERLLPLYRRLADETAQDPHVRLRAASAQHRLGRIYEQLGRQEAALSAFWAARSLLETLLEEATLPADELRWELARVLNDLGEVERQSPQSARERREAHQQALTLLSQTPPEALTSDERLELARTHYLLGLRDMFGFGPPRGGPPRGERGRDRGDPAGDGNFGGAGAGSTGGGRTPPPPPSDPAIRIPALPAAGAGSLEGGEERARSLRFSGFGGFPSRESYRVHLTTAIKLLDDSPEAARDTRYRLLLARCYRELSAQRGREESVQRQRDWETAVKLLQDLVAEAPQMRDFRFELSETYADVEPRWLPDDRLPEIEERLRKALELARPLVGEADDVPAYASGLTHILTKLANVLRRTGRVEEAEANLREAMALQASQAERSPGQSMHIVWRARISRTLADVLLEHERDEEAAQLLREAGRTIEPLLSSEGRRSNPALFFASYTLGEIYGTLERILREQGETDAADRYRAQSIEYGPGSYFRRRPPLDASERPAREP